MNDRWQNGGVVALTLVGLVDLVSGLKSHHVSGDDVAAVDGENLVLSELESLLTRESDIVWDCLID